MSAVEIILPPDFPDYLRHSDDDTPVPTWAQVTRSAESDNPEMTLHVSRIVADTADAGAAREVWEAWPGNYRRSVALLVDKIYNEGWLDAVGPISEWPWEGGFFFRPVPTALGGIVEVLDSKSGRGGTYTEGGLRGGFFAHLSTLRHAGWERSWMENDTGTAALHVGVFRNGTAEVHFDMFNSLYTNGAPRSDVINFPLLGRYNKAMFRLHRRWERAPYADVVRTSANYYHMMRGSVPLCF
jgi:hypothetical protein